ARIPRPSGLGHVDEAATEVVVEPVRLRAAATLRAEAHVEIGPAVTVEVAPAGSVLAAARLDPRRRGDVLEAPAAQVPVERGARAVVADVDVDAPVAVEVGERRVVGGDGTVETGRCGDVHERCLRGPPAADREEEADRDDTAHCTYPSARSRSW